MESVVLISESKSDLSALLTLAKKLGIGIKRLSTEEMEDKLFLKMMKDDSKSGKADTKQVLKKLGIK